METYSIAAIIVVAVLFASFYIYRHVRGEGGGCCGNCKETKNQIPKLENPVISHRIISIEGMHCAHCKNAVEAELNNFKGVQAQVDLKKGIADVKTDREILDDELIQAVESCGFKVKNIENAEL